MAKIGIDARMMGPKMATGVGLYIEKLINYYSGLNSDHEFVVFVKPENVAIVPKSPNIKTVLTKAHWYTYQEQTTFLLQLIYEKLDLVHFPNFNFPILYPKPFIITIHDLTAFKFPGHKMRSKFRKTIFNLVFKLGLKKASKIIAISGYTKSDIISNFNTNSDKIEVIYQGVEKVHNLELKSDKIDVTLARFHITKPYILYVGVQRNHKNIIGLIKSFIELKKTHDIQLVIGGAKNKHYPEMESFINSINFEIKKDIIRTDYLENNDLNHLYSSALAYVVPSFEEGFGLNGLEAMSFGIPVVSSNSSSLPEIYKNAAKYFDPYQVTDITNSVREVISNQNLRDSLINAGFQRIKDFDWTNTTSRTLSLYEETLLRLSSQKKNAISQAKKDFNHGKEDKG